VAVVLDGGVPLRHVAAVTFTEKAAAELRDRLRAAFEYAMRAAADDSARLTRAEEALDDLDAAAIGTLHSFAQRILGEHPIEAGLPPLIEVLDEVASQVAFEERWTALRAALLDDEELRRPLLLGLAAGVKLEQLRSIAHDFNSEWDRLDAAVLASGPVAVPTVDAQAVIADARALLDMESHCRDDSDLFLEHLGTLRGWVARLEQSPDEPAVLEALGDAVKLRWHTGRAPNWRCDMKELRAQGKALIEHAKDVRQQVLDRVLRRLAYRIAEATIDAARERQREGSLEFHDLLVLARELLRSPKYGAQVRARLHERYQRLLLDEFQDTDPIQIELAVRIAGGEPAADGDWRDVAVPPGRLFVVGDPKQSIYRFRRADIATYLEAEDRIGDRVELTTNFRTTKPVLRWVNAVFKELIAYEDGSQPEYQSLDFNRAEAPGGTRVLSLGMQQHPKGLNADEVREREAADVAAAIRTALTERWQVLDTRTQEWRDVALDDIAVLMPARTSLPQLEDALDRAGIPYRVEASSLVYRTAEVRDLLMTARAVDDPSDALALASALRSPVFGCGDDDLWTWKRDGGSFNLLATPPESVPTDHPVREAVDYLRELHRERRWRAPSELLDRIVTDRRMLEAGADGPRARDVWRRLRFVVDQARAWSEAEHGGLRAYLAWAYRQGDESARVAEAVLPETDTHAVRVSTIHSAKGLEFPVVIVSGLSSRTGGHRGVEVLWPRSGGYAISLNKSIQTGDFEAAKPIDEQIDYHERLRLLYVACTRARDHLVVSLHRVSRNGQAAGRRRTNAELLAEASAGAPHIQPLGAVDGVLPPGVRIPAVEPPVSYAEWSAGVTAAQEAARRPAAISASSLHASPATYPAEPAPGLAKDARNLELPPWNKGRYGSAIGRAVHGALQTVDLSTGAGV
ncbi:MAG: UvrD-helicase domain-containing protein, partial [Actinomycetota bacterium]|nr:UvrD-helicase domain-containing protein [Actinomycetota bacterium]